MELVTGKELPWAFRRLHDTAEIWMLTQMFFFKSVVFRGEFIQTGDRKWWYAHRHFDFQQILSCHFNMESEMIKYSLIQVIAAPERLLDTLFGCTEHELGQYKAHGIFWT